LSFCPLTLALFFLEKSTEDSERQSLVHHFVYCTIIHFDLKEFAPRGHRGFIPAIAWCGLSKIISVHPQSVRSRSRPITRSVKFRRIRNELVRDDFKCRAVICSEFIKQNGDGWL